MGVVVVEAKPLITNTITNAHFGGNFLFNRNFFGEGVSADGGYDEVAQLLGITHLRYPGGGMSETQFSLQNPENNYQDTNLIVGGIPFTNTKSFDLTPMSEFLAYAQTINGQVSLVLPTMQYKDALLNGIPADLQAAKSEIQSFVRDVLSGSYGETIEVFELGNEYYGKNLQLSHGEYGKIANTMAIWVQEAIDTSGSGYDPMIAIQSGQRFNNANQSIISEFSSDGLSAIDAVIAHTYQMSPWSDSNTAGKASLIDDWNAAKGEGANLKWIVSEWNVSPNAADGLLQGAGILEMFNELVRNGMDLGHIWPVFQNTETELAGDVVLGEETNLLVSGEVFRQLSESTIGLQTVGTNTKFDVDSDGIIDVTVHFYLSPNNDELVAFVSSLDAGNLEFELDLSSFGNIATNYDHLWGTKIGVLDGQDPLSPESLPKVMTLTSEVIEGGITNDGIVSINLEPYQISRLVFSIGKGVSIKGHDQTEQDDILYGSSYNDVLNGFGGADILKAGRGEDQLFGGAGKDVLHGRGGDDLLLGGEDKDRLLGGSGNDRLFGQGGNDILRGGAGNDWLEGGGGADVFIFRDNWGQDEVTDFQDGIDSIIFQQLNLVDADDAINHATQLGRDVVFAFEGGESLTINDITVADIYDDIFIF
ncbi:MAG: hypothetical protein JKY41_11700 [Rhodobacteraceae bacterium]|nr:hypothetical protein [Paracoccaceae bacterium]